MRETIDNNIHAAGGVIAGEPRARWAVFLAQWLRHPRQMSSVTPSGRQLGRLMASALPDGARCVVELGAGTGAITTALLQHGIAPDDLLAVEMNPVLHRLLRHRLPAIHAMCGDARRLETLVQVGGHFSSGHVDAICSSLGLLNMPRAVQRDILTAAFGVIRPDGAYIQYTYGRRQPLDEGVRDELGLRCTRVGTAWCNLPPARVYVYARRTPIAVCVPAHSKTAQGT